MAYVGMEPIAPIFIPAHWLSDGARAFTPDDMAIVPEHWHRAIGREYSLGNLALIEKIEDGLERNPIDAETDGALESDRKHALVRVDAADVVMIEATERRFDTYQYKDGHFSNTVVKPLQRAFISTGVREGSGLHVFQSVESLLGNPAAIHSVTKAALGYIQCAPDYVVDRLHIPRLGELLEVML